MDQTTSETEDFMTGRVTEAIGSDGIAGYVDPIVGYTHESFAKFWANPKVGIKHNAELAHGDVVGYWPGSDEPVRGLADYTERLEQVLALVPDIQLEVLEHARNGDVMFIRWQATGTGPNGRFEFRGVDRMLIEDGLLKENVILFDSAEFNLFILGEGSSQ
jgi:SnoaL-like polyketide cyclase